MRRSPVPAPEAARRRGSSRANAKPVTTVRKVLHRGPDGDEIGYGHAHRGPADTRRCRVDPAGVNRGIPDSVGDRGSPDCGALLRTASTWERARPAPATAVRTCVDAAVVLLLRTYFPVHTGVRFSANARAPSFASSLANTFFIASLPTFHGPLSQSDPAATDSCMTRLVSRAERGRSRR